MGGEFDQANCKFYDPKHRRCKGEGYICKFDGNNGDCPIYETCVKNSQDLGVHMAAVFAREKIQLRANF
jgi:hypothetical protein